MTDYYDDNNKKRIREFFAAKLKIIGIIRGTHIFASAASVFLTPYISKDHETKFGTFVHSVTISCCFPLSVLYYGLS